MPFYSCANTISPDELIPQLQAERQQICRQLYAGLEVTIYYYLSHIFNPTKQ
jgi:hypothetical protein